MLHFDAQDYPYTSKRNVVYAKNGMVCVGNPTAASANGVVLIRIDKGWLMTDTKLSGKDKNQWGLDNRKIKNV